MTWTLERRRAAAIAAPMAKSYVRADTRTIEHEGWIQVVTPSAIGFLNEVCLTQVAPEDAERVIDETLALYRAEGLTFAWTLSPLTRPADLGDRLRARGFTGVRALYMGAPTDLAVPVPGDVIAREVDDEASLEAFVAASAEGWSLHDRQRDIELATHRALLAAEPRRVRFWNAVHDAKVVGTGVVVLQEDRGYLMGTQVLRAARGRGSYRSLVAARLAHLRAAGIAYAVTLAGETTSAPILARLGFEELAAAEVFRIDPREVDSLRA